MRPYYFLYLILLIAHLSCSQQDAKPEPSMVFTRDATLISPNQIKLTGVITNFNPAMIAECGFDVYGNGFSETFNIKSPKSKDIEIIIDISDLLAFSTYSYTAYVIKIDDRDPTQTYKELDLSQQTKTFTTDLPTVTSVLPDGKVSDYTTMTVNGKGFTENTYLYFGSKPSLTKPIEYVSLVTKSRSEEEYIAYLPSIGARGKDIPAFFEDRILPSALYVGNYDKSSMKKIKDLDYRYLFELNDKSGIAGGTFTVTIYYARQSPLLEKVAVYVGTTQVSIIERNYRFTVGPGNFLIEGYNLKCTVPPNLNSGTYQIKVVSPFEEEFKANINGSEFTIN